MHVHNGSIQTLWVHNTGFETAQVAYDLLFNLLCIDTVYISFGYYMLVLLWFVLKVTFVSDGYVFSSGLLNFYILYVHLKFQVKTVKQY